MLCTVFPVSSQAHVLISGTEGGQLATRARRQRTVSGTLPLSHSRLSAFRGTGRLAHRNYSQLRVPWRSRATRVQDCHHKPYRRSFDRHDGVPPRLACTLVTTSARLQQREVAASPRCVCRCCHGRLRVHAATVAAVPETRGCRRGIRCGHKPASVRGVDVICACIDPRGRTRLKGLQTVSGRPG
jgi:hypothetical protein